MADIVHTMRSGNAVIFQIAWMDPRSTTSKDTMDNTDFTALVADIVNPADDAIISPNVPFTFRTNAGVWSASVADATLTPYETVTLKFKPTRAVGLPKALGLGFPVPVRLTDALKEIDEGETAVTSQMTTFESNMQAEHDATQAQLATHDTDQDAEHAATRALVQAETDALDAAVADLDADLVTHEANRASMQTTMQSEHDTTQSDISSFRTAMQAEHDTTQNKLDNIAAASEAHVFAPTTHEIPDTGSTQFVLDFVLKDLDLSPTALTDPDGNIVDVTVINQFGAAPTGVTLGGTPAGRMTRDAQGEYSLIVTVASTATDNDQLRFSADYVKESVANTAKASTTLGDFDQLDNIESQVNAIRYTDVPAIQANIDAAEADLAAHRAEVEPELDQIKQDTTTDIPDQMTAFQAAMQAEHDSTQSQLATHDTDQDAEHAATRALVQAETDAIDSQLSDMAGPTFNPATDSLEHIHDDVADLDADLVTHEANRASMETTLVAEHDSTQAQLATHDADQDAEHATTRALIQAETDAIDAELANGTYGLAALNADLDAILACLGCAVDGEDIKTKLNNIKAVADAINDREQEEADEVVGDYGPNS